MKKQVGLIIGFLIIGGLFNQAIFAYSNGLIWRTVVTAPIPVSFTGNDQVTLPELDSNNFQYKLVFMFYNHVIPGAEWEKIDVTFLHLISLATHEFSLEIDLRNDPFGGWVSNSVFFQITAGDYNISWVCTMGNNYEIELYFEEISSGDQLINGFNVWFLVIIFFGSIIVVTLKILTKNKAKE